MKIWQGLLLFLVYCILYDSVIYFVTGKSVNWWLKHHKWIKKTKQLEMLDNMYEEYKLIKKLEEKKV